MRIRQSHPIRDRLKVVVFLFLLLWVEIELVKTIQDEERKKSTIEMLLKTSLQPVGSTMYVWGGGWNEGDSAAGYSSTQLGVSPQWAKFANKQDEEYDFNEYRFEREKGLDCSGYVGWVLYNTFEKKAGQPGYVMSSTNMAKDYSQRGWGELIENPKQFLPGDIVSMEGHVWISLGTCADGSVLLVHSSPPGVSVCGTYLEEKESSIAIELATAFMIEYYPDWQEKYPNRGVANTYLREVSLMRWNVDTMIDAKKYQNLSGEEIMKLLRE